ncbi:DUF938 domain-containing protein [Shewanella sp. 6_MG-2023]|uniref:DUF938 domain-containing protein n=1 Tax=Shewanella sp. 6_MG-2023 TaxID=3062660 RepID=UPI0026E14DAC|nr:DUF938 domain-containing protein [Shewanella sp. 6_MG-2023]MDO6618818.1 DUF938 domain-containing protein [Shewanella sp. 6_MG-2023]
MRNGKGRPILSELSQLPFSQACENNKKPILTELKSVFSSSTQVLEIGSGTGQHCVYFAKHLPRLIWQASDQSDYLAQLNSRIHIEGPENLLAAIELDVTKAWPSAQIATNIDGLFSANTLHIMSESMVVAFFEGLGQYLNLHANVAIYGPFNYQGQFSSDSNAQFDMWLKQNNPQSGIRDIEWITSLASDQGLSLQADTSMPANNRLLHFSRS